MKRALESYLKKSPVFSMLLGCVLISIGPFFVEASQIGSIANTFYRMLIGGICLCLITLIKKESFPKQAAASLCFCAALGLNLDLLTWNQSI
ncbi:MAG: hypothetical protein EBZ47_07890, partial [Chlamydiae bacterium]|nr:hypothetical protein [Chlamydiota bacterium]